MNKILFISLACLLAACTQTGVAATPGITQTETPRVAPTFFPPPEGFLPTYIERHVLTPAAVLDQVLDGTRTATFGEWHVVDNEDVLVEYLPLLKEHGYRYFAVEVSVVYQPAFDRFNHGEIDEDTLQDLMKVEYEDQLGHPMVDDSTMRMYARARELGFTLVPVDDLEVKDQSFTHNRDQLMYSNIQDKILAGDPQAKVFFFGGSSHAVEGNGCSGMTLGRLLEENIPGINSNASILFAGPTEVGLENNSIPVPFAFLVDTTLAGYDFQEDSVCPGSFLKFAGISGMIIYQEH
jgi:hypothetical protein